MPVVHYGGKQGKRVQLSIDRDLLAVRTRSRQSLRAGPVARPEASHVREMDLVLDFPDAGVEVYRKRPSDKRALRDVRAALQRMPDTRFAGRVLVDQHSGEPVVYTENLVVKFRDEEEREHCLAVLRDAGLTVKQELPYATNAFFVSAPEGTGQEVFAIAERLLAREDVETCQPELVRRLGRRQIAAQQWHLRTTTIGGRTISASANVEAAHALATGEGVTIAIIDTGIDVDHAEFASAGKVVAPRDTTSSDADPRPNSSGENHGTACAGVACADGRVGACGVAPRAKLMPIRMQSALGSIGEANAFWWAAQNGADVISCSWGPVDGDWWDANDPLHSGFTPIADQTRLAIDWAVQNGRGGKGCVILFAAGNGNESVDNDGYASYPKVIAVAACNDRGVRSVYSDFGSAVHCSFPSNDFGFDEENRPEPLTDGIWTTDRSGARGYGTGDYTSSFGGTSSACPGAAGVAALVLSRNPALRWDQVRDLLKRSCDRIDAANGAYDASGHSDKYGYGRLNAFAAVQLAAPAEAPERLTVRRTYQAAVADFQKTSVALPVGASGALESLEVQVDVEHTYIGDLVVSLIPPPGMGAGSVRLHDRTGGATRNIRRTYDALSTPNLKSYAGKDPAGEWTLEVRDEAKLDQGTIRGLALVLTFRSELRSAVSRRASSDASRKTSRGARARNGR